MKKLVITSLLALPLILTSCSNKDENVKEYENICNEIINEIKRANNTYWIQEAIKKFRLKEDAFDKKLYEEIQVPKLEELYRKGLVDKSLQEGQVVYIDKSNDLNEMFQNDPQFREQTLKSVEDFLK
jgi:predicted DNA-binding transcriptional regulator